MESLSLAEVRRLILHGQGLLTPPHAARDALEIVRTLGYVQVDAINVLERAHHLTLGARMDVYRPHLLKTLCEQQRALFEGWTHDACLIPMEHEPHWGLKRQRFARSHGANKWWTERMGSNPSAVQREVLRRIEKEGPLPTRAFRKEDSQRGTWWGWTPEKSALEYSWRVGVLAVAGRDGFEKIYDLAERVLPRPVKQPGREETMAWCCLEALKRLGVAGTGELAAFWSFFKASELEDWCLSTLPRVKVNDVEYWVRPDFAQVLATAPSPPTRLRLLCPFDPLIRDRQRLSRFFSFDYRFEAYVPGPKRQFGYYTLPMLQEDRLVGRLDAKLHRKREVLEVRGCWWESGERAKRRALQSELARLARRVGAGGGVIEGGPKHLRRIGFKLG